MTQGLEQYHLTHLKISLIYLLNLRYKVFNRALYPIYYPAYRSIVQPHHLCNFHKRIPMLPMSLTLKELGSGMRIDLNLKKCRVKKQPHELVSEIKIHNLRREPGVLNIEKN